MRVFVCGLHQESNSFNPTLEGFEAFRLIESQEMIDLGKNAGMAVFGIVSEFNPFHNGHLYHIKKVRKVLTGGKDTQESKMNALRYLKTYAGDDDIVLLHDAVRPLVTPKLISDNIAAVREYGSAVTVVPFTETGVVSEDGVNTNKSIIRNTMYIAKAPQSFYFKDVWDAHLAGEDMPYTITIDTCSLMTELGKKLHMVPCETTNIKITTPEDYFIFKALIDLRESNDIFGF